MLDSRLRGNERRKRKRRDRDAMVMTMLLLLEPPPQYDHPYHGHVIEQRLSPLQMMATCHGPGESCAWVSHGVCHIALPAGEKDRRLLALIREHEIGHCNGWPSYHPGGRRVEYGADKRPPAFKSGGVSVRFD